MSVSTGSSLEDRAGSVTIGVGSSSIGFGNIHLHSGATSDEASTGGSATIQASDGAGGGGPLFLKGGVDSGADADDPKAGGPVTVEGGASLVGVGGTVSVLGGSSELEAGGSLHLSSGYSDSDSSRDIALVTADGSIDGKTAIGTIRMASGDSSRTRRADLCTSRPVSPSWSGEDLSSSE